MHSTSAQSKSKWATFSSNHSENLKAPPGRMSSADSAKGLCPLDTRNFFEKKLTKSFTPAAAGTGAFSFFVIFLNLGYLPAKIT